MTRHALAFLIFLFVSVNSKSIDISEKLVKREARDRDTFFPDWVPFKNKHGDELGEFVQVKPKKPRKRLALPKNFILRAVAAPEGDDYYDKDQGETDGEDYEKRDWSDINRPQSGDSLKINDTHLSGSDGRSKVLSKNADNTYTTRIYTTVEPVTSTRKISERSDDEHRPKFLGFQDETLTTENPKKKSKQIYMDYMDYGGRNSGNFGTSVNAESPKSPSNNDNTDKIDSDEDQDQNENETTKSNALDGVDELKKKHAKEQKAISDSYKDTVYKEDLVGGSEFVTEDKYSNTPRKRPDYDDYEDKDEKEVSVINKYEMFPPKKVTKPTTQPTIPITNPAQKLIKEKIARVSTKSGKITVFKNPGLYMIYDDDSETTTPEQPVLNTMLTSTSSKPTESSSGEVVRISLVPGDSESAGEPTLFFPKRRKEKRKKKPKIPKGSESGQSNLKSVNPIPSSNLSTIIDKRPIKPNPSNLTVAPGNFYLSQGPTQKSIKNPNYVPHVLLPESKINQPSGAQNTTDSLEISSLETDSKDSSTSPGQSDYTDSSEISHSTAASYESAPSGPEPSSHRLTHVKESDPSHRSNTHDLNSAEEPPSNFKGEIPRNLYKSASKLEPAASDLTLTAVDAAEAESEQIKEEHKDHGYKHEMGGGKEHHSEHDSHDEEGGAKSYEAQHDEKEKSKGYHDKEDHIGKYNDHGGVDQRHEDEKKHFGSHIHEEKGKKHAEYEESGKHSKGHSTKGSHDIHKKEEYEKKVEFFEEKGDSIEEEKHVGHSRQQDHDSGTRRNMWHADQGSRGRTKGESSAVKKDHGFAHHRHREAGGANCESQEKNKKIQVSNDGGKKWIYHHGNPPKNANLVVIDRRTDQYFHGPQYYG